MIRQIIVCGLLLLLPLIPSMGQVHPIPIYYGLNESYSKSWARMNDQGIIGISYCVKDNYSETWGVLVYQAIAPDGSIRRDTVAFGQRLEKTVLLFDSTGKPHIFVAQSNNSDQWIDHYSQDSLGFWQPRDPIVHFQNEGGKFIYELSADSGPDGSFHLLVLKTRSDIDSDQFDYAWIGSSLYHLTNATGTWEKDRIRTYDMVYTWDMMVKTLYRQDLKVDRRGFVHVLYQIQMNAFDYFHSPSWLFYATNASGEWISDTVLSTPAGSVDDRGWYPSLALDTAGVPHIACTECSRVPTKSARWCRLLYVTQSRESEWRTEVLASQDDGYYGGDGRNYTGALSHLVFDARNRPHIAFSDIASSHWPWYNGVVNNCLLLGNIRYAVYDEIGWNFTTVYRQPRPTGFYHATEMQGMCLFPGRGTDSIRVIGQELVIPDIDHYTSNLVHIAWNEEGTTGIAEEAEACIPHSFLLTNFPNPFNPVTTIQYQLPWASTVHLTVYNLLGQQIATLVDEVQEAGYRQIVWNASGVTSGVYLYRLQAVAADDAGRVYEAVKKVILMK